MSMSNSEIQAARLAHPSMDVQIDNDTLSPYEAKSIYDFLRKNRVIFRAMNLASFENLGFPRKNMLVKELIENNHYFAEAYNFALYQTERCAEFIKGMNAVKAPAIFIKSLNKFPIDSHNFDVLVKEKDLELTKSVLERLGYSEMVQIREPYKWFYRKVEANFIVSFHVHIRIAWEGVEFVDSNDVWENYQEKADTNLLSVFPSAEHQLLITVAHAFFENQGFKLCDICNIIDAVSTTRNLDWDYIVDWCTKDKWLNVFYALLKLANHVHLSIYKTTLIDEEVFKLLEQRGKIKNITLGEKLIAEYKKSGRLPLKIPATLVGFAFIQKVTKTKGKPLTKKMMKTVSTGLHYVKRRVPLRAEYRASVICFSGQDGSGKTTHAYLLQRELAKMIHTINDEQMERNFRIRYVWSRGIGLTFDPFLTIVRKLLMGSKSASGKKYEQKKRGFLKREPIKTLWAYITLLDEVIQIITKVKLPLMTRNIVICDRYICDVFVDINCELNKNINWPIKRIVINLLPKPELQLITDAPIEDITRRKEDLDLSVVCCKKREYASYLKSQDFVLINTSEPPERVSQEVFQRVLRTLMF